MLRVYLSLVLLVSWLGCSRVGAIQVTCFESSSCADEATSRRDSRDALCCAQSASSYRTMAGVCCNCTGDVQVRLSSSTYSVSEGAGLFTGQVQRCGQFEDEVGILLTYEDITARGGRDYGPFPTSTLTLPSTVPINSSAFVFAINIRDNGIVEHSRMFSVGVTIQGEDLAAARQLSGRLANVTIIDDDFVNVTVEPTSFTVMESRDREVALTLRKEGVAVRDVVVALVPSASISTIGADYEPVRGELTFAPEVTTINVSLSILDDDVVEAAEDVKLVLVPGDGERGVVFPEGMAAVNGIIEDDNDSVSVVLQEGVSAPESAGEVRIVLRKEGRSERNVSVVVSVAMPTTAVGVALAEEGRDFDLSPAQSMVTFEPSEVTKTVLVGVYQDGIFEQTESFYLRVEPGVDETSVQVREQPTAILIEDSDSVAVGFGSLVTRTSEAAGMVNVSVELQTGLLDIGVDLEVFVTKETTDLAEVDEDFNLVSPRVSFLPGGPRVATVTVDVLDDPFFEGREDLTLGLRAITQRVNVTTSSTTVSIVDNEDLVLTFENTSYVVSESEPYVDIRLTLQVNIERSITLDLVTSDRTASAGIDYEAVSQTLTFTPSIATREVRVNILDDRLSEGLEDFSVDVVLVDRNLGQPGVITRTPVQIVDDENIFVGLASVEVSVTEGLDQLAVVVVQKSGETEQDIDVVLSVNDGSAIGGRDYGFFPASSLNFSISIPSSQSQQTFPVVIRDDNIIERSEDFTVTLLLAPQSGNVFIRGIDKTRVNIVDNDVVNFSLRPNTSVVRESGETLTFSLMRLDDYIIDSRINTINFTVLTVEGSAVASRDFLSNSMTVQLNNPSPSSYTFNITLLDDEVAEMTERFSIVIRPEVSSAPFFSSDDISSVVDITDDDIVLVDFSLPVYEVVESFGTAMVCVLKDRDTSVPFNITITPYETTPTAQDVFQARAGFDFDPSPLEATFMPDLGVACVNIPIVKDQLVGESKEVFGVRMAVPMSAASPGIQIGTGSRATSAVIVNDIPDVVFGFDRAVTSVQEFVGEVDICVLISSPSPDEFFRAILLVHIEASFLSADSSDFQLLESTLTFNNSREECVPVRISNDNIFEDSSETAEITITSFNLSDPSLTAMASRASTQLVILDDDRSATVGFSAGSIGLLVDEGAGEARLCVEVTSPGPQIQFESILEVIVATRPLTATSADYTPISGLDADLILVLDTVNREVCFKVNITDDGRYEGPEPETFQVVLTPLFRALTDVENVIVAPAVTVVRIRDNDPILSVAFEDTVVEVDEDAGAVMLCAVVIGDSGQEFEDEFAARVRVLPGESTAEFQLDFLVERDLILLFSSANRKVCFNVTIIDDDSFESNAPENILLQLELLPGNQGLETDSGHSRLDIRIRENDVMPTTLAPTSEPSTASPTSEELDSTSAMTDSDSTTSAPTMTESDFTTSAPTMTDSNPTTSAPIMTESDSTTSATIMTESDSTTSVPTMTMSDSTPVQSVGETDSTTLPSTDEIPTILPIFANDTVLGETIFSVPLLFDNEDFKDLPDQARETTPHLCYEVQGRAGSYFNLLSDTCVSVNALYSAASISGIPTGFNIITKIGIATKDTNGSCVFVEIGVDNDCLPLMYSRDINGNEVVTPVATSLYGAGGVSVTRRQSHVRVSVPNCGRGRVVMYATCLTSGHSNSPSVRFDVTRGINLSPTSHGIMGQFWSIPVAIKPYVYPRGTDTYLDVSSLYAITVTPPSSSPRTFVAEYYTKKWDQTQETCFYAGNLQGGSLFELASDPASNSPVIEGNFLDYSIPGLFHSEFKFSKFNCFI